MKPGFKLNGKYLFAIVSALFFFAACTKKSDPATCTDSTALNYNKTGDCTYARDSILGDYLLTVIKYPLDPGQVGNQYTLSVRNASNSDHSLIEFDWLTPGVNPYDFTQQLSGYSFSFTPAYQVTWAGAPLTGTGTFSNDTLNFSGIVHSSDGDSVIVLKGYK